MASCRNLLKLSVVYTILMFSYVLNARMIYEFCKTLDKCTASTDKGVINLWPLVNANKPAVPRFKNIKDKSKSYLSYSWNPCNPWVLQTKINDTGFNSCLQNTSICMTRSQESITYHADIGNASTARFVLDKTSSKCKLVYDGNDFFVPSLVQIELICSTDEGRLEEFTSTDGVTNHDLNEYQSRLHSKYACPMGS